MSDWKKLFIKEFGKKASRKWMEAAMDIKLVDNGIKPSLLFDHWGVKPTEMKNFLVSAQESKMINSQIVLLVIGLDILIVNIKIITDMNVFKDESSSIGKNMHFIDVSYGLKEPKVIDIKDKNISCTSETFHALLKFFSSKNCVLNVVNIEDLVNLTSFNVPCLFGLLLGYPSVYWYNQKASEDNCLSGVALCVFQIIGVMDDVCEKDLFKQSSDDALKIGASVQRKVILSFSIPDSLKLFMHCHIHAWFSLWKSSRNWSSMFKDVIIEEQLQQPQAVAL